MAQINAPSLLVYHKVLREFAGRCLEKANLSEEDAGLVGDSLVESSLRGIDSHGVARLPHYLNRIRHGSINPRPALRFTPVSPALGRLDGDRGPGQIVMQRATREAISLAGEAGAGWVAVENSSHCGALAYYGLQIASAGMLGLVFTHSDSMVVPHGGLHAFCGTNPICLTAPAEGEAHFCLDMATSIVPWNTITNAAIEGVEIPDHWAVDGDGAPTRDPKSVRAVRAFGEFKGSGLGLMIDLFCSFLLASPYGPDIPAMYGDPSQPRRLGGLVGAIDIRRFRDVAAFRASLSQLAQRWTRQERADPQTPILFPGQPEQITREKRLAEGIPVGIGTCELFRKIACELDLPWPVAV